MSKNILPFDTLPSDLARLVIGYIEEPEKKLEFAREYDFQGCYPDLLSMAKPDRMFQATKFNTFLLNAQGNLFVCGRNEHGTLGVGDNKPRASLTKVEISDLKGSITQVIAKPTHTFVLTDHGMLYACGLNGRFQLGLGGITSPNLFTAVTIPNCTSAVVQVIAKSTHTFVLTASGELYTSGRNDNGQLGLGDMAFVDRFTKVTGFTNPISQIITRHANTFVLTNSGELYASGRDEIYTSGRGHGGQMGLGVRTVDRFTQVIFPELTGSLAKIIATGDYTFALTDSGELYASGSNDGSQLGLGEVDSVRSFTKVAGFTSPIRQITTKNSHTFVLTNSGELYVSGSGIDGRLGLGEVTFVNRFAKVTIPELTRPLTQIIAMANCTFALSDHGELYSCGDIYGVKRFTKMIIPGLISPLAQIIEANLRLFALTNQGELYACGLNDEGQMGLGHYLNTDRFTKVTIPGCTGVLRVIPLKEHTFVFTNTDELYACGSNEYYQLGLDRSVIDKEEYDTTWFSAVPKPSLTDISKLFRDNSNVLLKPISQQSRPRDGSLDLSNRLLGMAHPHFLLLSLKKLSQRVDITEFKLNGDQLFRWNMESWRRLLELLPPFLSRLDISNNGLAPILSLLMPMLIQLKKSRKIQIISDEMSALEAKQLETCTADSKALVPKTLPISMLDMERNFLARNKEIKALWQDKEKMFEKYQETALIAIHLIQRYIKDLNKDLYNERFRFPLSSSRIPALNKEITFLRALKNALKDPVQATYAELYKEGNTLFTAKPLLQLLSLGVECYRRLSPLHTDGFQM